MDRSATGTFTDYPWKRALGAAALWLGVGTLAGFVMMGIIREHGSIGYLICGLASGVSGTLSHAVLLASTRYRAKPYLLKAVALWLATITVLLLLSVAAATASPASSFGQGLWEWARFLLTLSAAPLLLFAPVAVLCIESAA